MFAEDPLNIYMFIIVKSNIIPTIIIVKPSLNPSFVDGVVDFFLKYQSENIITNIIDINIASTQILIGITVRMFKSISKRIAIIVPIINDTMYVKILIPIALLIFMGVTMESIIYKVNYEKKRLNCGLLL